MDGIVLYLIPSQKQLPLADIDQHSPAGAILGLLESGRWMMRMNKAQIYSDSNQVRSTL
jgi:hypothetical protein